MISVGLALVLSFEHTWGTVMAEHTIRIQVAEFGPQLAQKQNYTLLLKSFDQNPAKHLSLNTLLI